MDKKVDNRLQVRVNGAIFEWLQERAKEFETSSPDVQARNELVLFRDLLQQELKRIPLTIAEASCIADVLDDTLLDLSVKILVRYELFDAFQIARQLDETSSYSAKWSIDEDLLLKKVSILGPTGDHALREAIIKWRQKDLKATKNDFESVGLKII